MEKSKELPKGVCPSCWGKKYNSVMNREIGYPDFPGDKGFDTGSKIENIPCSKCEGTGKFPIPTPSVAKLPQKEEKPNLNHCGGCMIGERCICGKRYCYGECEQKEEVNFYQVGNTIKCGHCEPDKYAVVSGFKCNCKCHSSTLEEEVTRLPITNWEKDFDNKFQSLTHLKYTRNGGEIEEWKAGFILRQAQRGKTLGIKMKEFIRHQKELSTKEERNKLLNIIENGGTPDTVSTYEYLGEKYINQRQLLKALRNL